MANNENNYTTQDEHAGQFLAGEKKVSNNLGKMVERVLLQHFTPACVVVDGDGEILYVHGSTGKYLELAQGKVSTNILQMARKGLRMELAKAIRKASAQKEPVQCKSLQLASDKGHDMVNITVIPFLDENNMSSYQLMVIFEDVKLPETWDTLQEMAVAQEPDVHRKLQTEQCLGDSETQELLQELYIHQLELELKNEDAQKALKASEEHFRQMAEILPEAVLGIYENKIVFTNNAVTNLLHGENSHSLQGKNLLDFLVDDYKELFVQNLQRVMHGNVDKIYFPVQLISLKGLLIDANLHIIPFTYRDKGGVLVIAYIIGNTNKFLQENMDRDRLKSIWMLVGGIAHDFRNYLASLLGNVSLAMLHINSPEKLSEKLTNIENLTLRARDLTHHLSILTKGEITLRKTVSMGNLISESINLALTGSSVQCELAFSPDLHMVEIDVEQINQVLYNIALNAVQAMPEGGTIRVKGENISFSEDIKEKQLPLEQGEYVKISIADEGPGIPENQLGRIYEPFFSTKAEGTGLGLATSYLIIENHGGYIHAESKEGKGATLIVYLPACKGDADTSNNEDNIIYGSGRILIMDGEKEIREVMDEMLTILGYEVHLTKNDTEAVELFREAAAGEQPFDLVVLDLNIPGGSEGRGVFDQLLAEEPDVKCILCSCYVNNPYMADYEAHGFKGVIKKPFDIGELSRVIHGAIKGI